MTRQRELFPVGSLQFVVLMAAIAGASVFTVFFTLGYLWRRMADLLQSLQSLLGIIR